MSTKCAFISQAEYRSLSCRKETGIYYLDSCFMAALNRGFETFSYISQLYRSNKRHNFSFRYAEKKAIKVLLPFDR